MDRLLTDWEIYPNINLNTERTYYEKQDDDCVSTFNVNNLLEAQDVKTARLVAKEVAEIVNDYWLMDCRDFMDKYPDYKFGCYITDYINRKYGVKDENDQYIL
jgi:hypothetical protein